MARGELATVTATQTIEEFNGLYIGDHAQARRESGEPAAMPPWAEVSWLGKQVCKCPIDLWTYQEIIFETKPDLLIETGASGGGSAFFFATLFDLIGSGNVVTIDKDAYPELWRKHSRVSYLHGDSLNGVLTRATAGFNGRVMVVLDSLHTYEHVKRELELYAGMVTPGCYLVIEDTVAGLGAERAAAEFVSAHPEFEVDHSRERHLLTLNRGGWLRRKF